MKRIIFSLSILFFTLDSWTAFAQSSAELIFSAQTVSNREFVATVGGVDRQCKVSEDLVEVKISSDQRSLIVSGTSYISGRDMMNCTRGLPLKAVKAAPHIGFLSDVNLNAKIYASLVPVAVGPTSFLTVVARLGSDRNLIRRPGFYRAGAKRETLLSEASVSVSPTLSIDGRFVSLDLHSCDFDDRDRVSVVEIKTGNSINLSPTMCKDKFRFE
jgi:hypothetical protein